MIYEFAMVRHEYGCHRRACLRWLTHGDKFDVLDPVFEQVDRIFSAGWNFKIEVHPRRSGGHVWISLLPSHLAGRECPLDRDSQYLGVSSAVTLRESVST